MTLCYFPHSHDRAKEFGGELSKSRRAEHRSKEEDLHSLTCADRDKIVYETADLWFHTLVMLSHQGLTANDILDELARRFGLSGLEEKAGRPT